MDRTLVRRRGRYALAIGGFLILWASFSVASSSLLVLPRQHLFDFYPRWEGSRAVLTGETPYSQEVSWKIQEAMFGRRQKPDEIVQHYVYPATLTWLLLPFWLLPYQAATSLWLGLQLSLLLVSLLSVMSLLKWKLPGPTFFSLLFLSLAAFRYPIIAYILGQFIPFILACLIVTWWGMAGDKPALALLGLVGLLVRPEVVVIPLGVLLFDHWAEGKRGVVAAWTLVAIALWLWTRLWIGPWELDFLKGIVSYTGYSFLHWPPFVLGHAWLAVALALSIVGWGAWMLWRFRSLPRKERLPWEISVSVLVTLLVLPQPNNYTLVLALIPAWVTLWASEGSRVDWLLLSVVLISPWVFHSLRDSLPPGAEQLLIPLAIAALLTRRWVFWVGGEKKRIRSGAPAATGQAEATLRAASEKRTWQATRDFSKA